ncbi:MAG: hypothetical protein PVH45_01605, partial [Candidatus Omnitrophota bacterium]
GFVFGQRQYNVGYPYFYSESFQGEMDNMIIWSNWMSATSITNVINGTSPTSYSGLRAWYPCNETSGSTIYDQSGNGYNATWYNLLRTNNTMARIWFDWGRNSQYSSDYLRFFVDGKEKAYLNSNTSEYDKMFKVPQGTHTLGWAYYEHYNGGDYSSGSAWIDNFDVETTSGTTTYDFNDPKDPLEGGYTGPAGWHTDDYRVSSGLQSARSGWISHGDASYLTKEVIGAEYSTDVSFSWYVSSYYDYIRFLVDGREIYSLCGDSSQNDKGWNYQSYTLSPGDHTLQWVYTKNSSQSGGMDSVWVDNIWIGDDYYSFEEDIIESIEATTVTPELPAETAVLVAGASGGGKWGANPYTVALRDGDFSTYYGIQGDEGATIEYRWDSPKVISGTKVYFSPYSQGSPGDYHFEYWDGSSWQSPPDWQSAGGSQSSGMWHEFDLSSPVMTDRIRFIRPPTGSGSGLGLAEWEVTSGQMPLLVDHDFVDPQDTWIPRTDDVYDRYWNDADRDAFDGFGYPDLVYNSTTYELDMNDAIKSYATGDFSTVVYTDFVNDNVWRMHITSGTGYSGQTIDEIHIDGNLGSDSNTYYWTYNETFDGKSYTYWQSNDESTPDGTSSDPQIRYFILAGDYTSDQANVYSNMTDGDDSPQFGIAGITLPITIYVAVGDIGKTSFDAWLADEIQNMGDVQVLPGGQNITPVVPDAYTVLTGGRNGGNSWGASFDTAVLSDGQLETYYGIQGEEGATVEYRWSTPRTIDGMRINFKASGSDFSRAGNYLFQYWDGSAWQTPSEWESGGARQAFDTWHEFTLSSPITTEKVRFVRPPNLQKTGVGVTEWQVMAGGTNIAPRMDYDDLRLVDGRFGGNKWGANYDIAALADGSYTSFYGLTGSESAIIEYTLDSPQQVRGMTISFAQGSSSSSVPGNYSFQYWDGSAWRAPSAWNSYGAHQEFDVTHGFFLPESVLTDKVRFVRTGDQRGVGIREWKVLATAPGEGFLTTTPEWRVEDGVMRSGRIAHEDTTYFTREVSFSEDMVVSFDWKLDSYDDYLRFYIDGIVRDEIRMFGSEIATDWITKGFVLPAGEHTLMWAYAKNSGDTPNYTGEDAAWVDNIEFKAFNAPEQLLNDFETEGAVKIDFENALPGAEIYSTHFDDAYPGSTLDYYDFMNASPGSTMEYYDFQDATQGGYSTHFDEYSGTYDMEYDGWYFDGYYGGYTDIHYGNGNYDDYQWTYDYYEDSSNQYGSSLKLQGVQGYYDYYYSDTYAYYDTYLNGDGTVSFYWVMDASDWYDSYAYFTIYDEYWYTVDSAYINPWDNYWGDSDCYYEYDLSSGYYTLEWYYYQGYDEGYSSGYHDAVFIDNLQITDAPDIPGFNIDTSYGGSVLIDEYGGYYDEAVRLQADNSYDAPKLTQDIYISDSAGGGVSFDWRMDAYNADRYFNIYDSSWNEVYSITAGDNISWGDDGSHVEVGLGQGDYYLEWSIYANSTGSGYEDAVLIDNVEIIDAPYIPDFYAEASYDGAVMLQEGDGNYDTARYTYEYYESSGSDYYGQSIRLQGGYNGTPYLRKDIYLSDGGSVSFDWMMDMYDSYSNYTSFYVYDSSGYDIYNTYLSSNNLWGDSDSHVEVFLGEGSYTLEWYLYKGYSWTESGYANAAFIDNVEIKDASTIPGFTIDTSNGGAVLIQEGNGEYDTAQYTYDYYESGSSYYDGKSIRLQSDSNYGAPRLERQVSLPEGGSVSWRWMMNVYDSYSNYFHYYLYDEFDSQLDYGYIYNNVGWGDSDSYKKLYLGPGNYKLVWEYDQDYNWDSSYEDAAFIDKFVTTGPDQFFDVSGNDAGFTAAYSTGAAVLLQEGDGSYDTARWTYDYYESNYDYYYGKSVRLQGALNDYSTTRLEKDLTLSADGGVSFHWVVSAGSTSYLNFNVYDDLNNGVYSTNIDYYVSDWGDSEAYRQIDLPAGTYKLVWEFDKQYSYDSGEEDAAFIDAIAMGAYTTPADVSDAVDEFYPEWQVVTRYDEEGSEVGKALRSGEVIDGHAAFYLEEVSLTDNKLLTFDWKMDYAYDNMWLYVDGKERARYEYQENSGTWEAESVGLSAGDHDLLWVYGENRDNDVESAGHGYLDNITLMDLTILDSPLPEPQDWDFESGSLVSEGFTTGGYSAWYAEYTTESGYGDYRARSDYVADGYNTSYLERDIYVTSAYSTVLEFDWKVDSANYDELRFYVDGDKKSQMFGSWEWEHSTFDLSGMGLSEGWHTIKWEYYKNSSGVAGEDAGWVDNVTVSYTGASFVVEDFESFG